MYGKPLGFDLIIEWRFLYAISLSDKPLYPITIDGMLKTLLGNTYQDRKSRLLPLALGRNTIYNA